MKNTSFFTALLAFSMAIVFGTTQAQASTQYGYYPLATNYYDTYRNCTPRGSDLGLGGGVFVAGTTVCPVPVVRYDSAPSYSYQGNQSYGYDHGYSGRDSGSQYYDEGSYDDSGYTDGYDDSDNGSEYGGGYTGNNSGGNTGSNSW